jgi:predicted transcriptional regulator
MNQEQIRQIVEQRMEEIGMTWYRLSVSSDMNLNGSYRIKGGHVSYTLKTLEKILPTLGLELVIRPVQDGKSG